MSDNKTPQNNSSFDSEDPVVTGKPTQHNPYNDGAPQLSRNFYINQDEILNHNFASINFEANFEANFETEDGGDSLSSLSHGGVSRAFDAFSSDNRTVHTAYSTGNTTISKVVGNTFGGLSLQDIENAGGDANFDDTTTICPDKDEFDYAYAYHIGIPRNVSKLSSKSGVDW